MNNYTYKETTNKLTGDVMWKIDDFALATGGVMSLIEQFIQKYKHPEYCLSIYDTITSKTIEITCEFDEIPKIVDKIYRLENGTPLTFVGINSITNCYIVGMSIAKGNIDFGYYKAVNGRLEKKS